jgi:hypothetical protein
LAWWLCQHTTARRRWVSERLGMGDESRVTQAIGRLKRKGPPELERLKRRLEQVYEDRNGERGVKRQIGIRAGRMVRGLLRFLSWSWL